MNGARPVATSTPIRFINAVQRLQSGQHWSLPLAGCCSNTNPFHKCGSKAEVYAILVTASTHICLIQLSVNAVRKTDVEGELVAAPQHPLVSQIQIESRNTINRGSTSCRLNTLPFHEMQVESRTGKETHEARSVGASTPIHHKCSLKAEVGFIHAAHLFHKCSLNADIGAGLVAASTPTGSKMQCDGRSWGGTGRRFNTHLFHKGNLKTEIGAKLAAVPKPIRFINAVSMHK